MFLFVDVICVMPRKKKLIDKKINKQLAGCCRICKEDDYALLDNHRIQEGSHGGRYTKFNVVVLCSNCHRRVHDKQIEIDRYVLATNGRYMLKVNIDGEERFI